MKSNITLAIDTSSSQGSIALGNGQVVINRLKLKPDQKASQSLFPALMLLGIPRLKLHKVVVGLGPGSFSGIRVALAAAHGIALVQGCPVVGVSSAFSMAKQKGEVPYLGLFADARRREVFCTEFRYGQIADHTYLIKAADLPAHQALFDEVASPEPMEGINQVIVPRAEDLLFPDDFPYWINQEPIEPIYLRSAEPELPVPKTPQPALDPAPPENGHLA